MVINETFIFKLKSESVVDSEKTLERLNSLLIQYPYFHSLHKLKWEILSSRKTISNNDRKNYRNEGPTFLEAKTYRYRGHSMSDAQLYRTKDEVEEYKKIDPIVQVKDKILEEKFASAEELEEIDKRVKEKVKECEEFAENSPFPDKNIMYDSVYEQENYPFIKHKLK